MKGGLSHHRTHCGNPFPVVWLRFAAICLLLPLSWSVLLSTQAWGAAPAPMVVRADPLNPARFSEAVFLGHRILARESKDMLLDEKRRRELAREIEGLLKRLKYAHPEIMEISARAAHAPGVILLGVTPELFAAVSRMLGDEKGPVKLRTGNRAFDALNAKLGLSAVRPYRHTGVLVMRFSERLNIRAARRAYLKIAGVENAEPDALLGDGSDIEAAKTGDAWHIVVRKAWGDCPAGCIYKKLFFFTVKDEDVERVEPSNAMEMPEFEKILETRKWR